MSIVTRKKRAIMFLMSLFKYQRNLPMLNKQLQPRKSQSRVMLTLAVKKKTPKMRLRQLQKISSSSKLKI